MGRHEDDRGVIEDLLEQPIDAVTKIFTRAGAVRGNHVHQQTAQWTYIVSGSLRVAKRLPGFITTDIYHAGLLIEEPAGIPHAWQALDDTVVLVFTRGPRSGESYESDTVRLSPEDHLL